MKYVPLEDLQVNVCHTRTIPCNIPATEASLKRSIHPLYIITVITLIVMVVSLILVALFTTFPLWIVVAIGLGIVNVCVILSIYFTHRVEQVEATCLAQHPLPAGLFYESS